MIKTNDIIQVDGNGVAYLTRPVTGPTLQEAYDAWKEMQEAPALRATIKKRDERIAQLLRDNHALADRCDRGARFAERTLYADAVLRTPLSSKEEAGFFALRDFLRHGEGVEPGVGFGVTYAEKWQVVIPK